MHLSARQWSVALAAAALVHAGVAAAILWRPPPAGAQSAGLGGVEVSLGPAGGAPGAQARAVQDVAEVKPVEAPEAAPAPEPVEAVAEAPVVEPEPAPPVEAIEPVAEPAPVQETVPVAETPPPEPVVEEVVQAAAPDPVVPVAPPPSAKPAPPRPEPKTADTKPPPTPKPPEPRVAEAKPAPPRQEAAARPTASAPGAGGKAGRQARPDTGDAESDSAGGGMPGVSTDFAALLQAWLAKHKEYPRSAQLRRQQGTALLYFVMDRTGRVLDYRLEKSSGYPLLDREVVAMIERAQPLPPIPDELGQDRLELVVPVQFLLR